MKIAIMAAISLLVIALVGTIACTSSSSSHVQITYCAAGCQTSWLGDGICQSACNNEACYYDNADCSSNTATPTPMPSTVGDTRFNPVPLSQPKQYGTQELTVLDAWEEPAGGFASSDEKALYVTVRIRFLQSATSTGYISSSDFRAVGTLGIISSNLWAASSDRNGIVFGEYFGGSTAEGNICGHVDKSDSNFVLIWSCGLGKSLYFALTTE